MPVYCIMLIFIKELKITFCSCENVGFYNQNNILSKL